MDIESAERIERLWADEELRAQFRRYPDDFPALPSVPAGRYTRADFYALEMARLWRKTWLFVGLANEVPEAGSFRLHELLGSSVILVRGEDQQIRAFHNTCQHRGATLVTQCSGKTSAFACRYHCWTYALDGRLRSVPDEHDFAGLERSRHALKGLRCERHGNLLFVNFDPDAQPLADFLAPLAPIIGDADWDRVRLYKSFEWQAECNWKCIHDAFSETYHVKYIHRNTVNAAINQLHTARHMLRNGHNAMVVKNRAAGNGEFANVFDRRPANEPADNALPGLFPITRRAQRSYNVFPNLTLPVAENLSTVLSVWPLAPDRCRVQLHYVKMVADQPIDTEADRQTVEFFNDILQEDFGAVKGMNASLASGAITEIPLSYGEQFLYNFNRELDRVIGVSHIPAELRIRQVELPVFG